MAAALNQSAAALNQSAAAALNQSAAAAALHPKPSPPARSLPISSFLRPLHLRRRSLSLSSRPRRGAAGAVMVANPSSSYASALADVALANKTLEATLADIEKLDRFFDSSVQTLFINPTIPIEKKREFIDQIAQSADLQPHTVNFLNIIVDMRRTELIKDIVNEFGIAFNKITGTELAVVTSVVPLESQHLAQIAHTVQRFTGAKNVRIKTEIDPSLIAGFTIRYGSSGSKLIDMSVKKQLDEIASQLDFSEIALV